MKDFVNKLSLYDILSMVIPGGTIFLFLSLTLGYKLKINKCEIDPVLGWTIALVLSYLLGLINHVCTALIWKGFRDTHIHWKERQWQSIGCYLVVWVLAIIILLVLGYMLLLLDKELFILLLAALLFLPMVLCSFRYCDNEMVLYSFRYRDNKEENHYYDKYYYVMKRRYNDDIPIMESQVAFVQNMLLPMALFLFFTPNCLNSLLQEKETLLGKTLYWYGTVAMFTMLVVVVFCRQKKIDYRINLDYKYLKWLEEYEENHK